MSGGDGAALPSLSGRRSVCCFAAVCSSVPRLFPQDVCSPSRPICQIHATCQPQRLCQYGPKPEAVSRVLTATIFYAIVRPGGVSSEHHCVYRIEYSHDTRAIGCIVNFNMHQGYLDRKGADGTSRFAERLSESPELVKPDDADAPKISPEPPPDSPRVRMSRRGRNPSVIIRGDLHTCPTKRIVVCAHISDERAVTAVNSGGTARDALAPLGVGAFFIG